MSKFLVDENFPGKVVKMIESDPDKHFDIFRVKGSKLEGCSDQEIKRAGNEYKRTIVTMNQHFSFGASSIDELPYGVLLFRLRRQSSAAVRKTLDKFCKKISRYEFYGQIVEIHDDYFILYSIVGIKRYELS